MKTTPIHHIHVVDSFNNYHTLIAKGEGILTVPELLDFVEDIIIQEYNNGTK